QCQAAEEFPAHLGVQFDWRAEQDQSSRPPGENGRQLGNARSPAAAGIDQNHRRVVAAPKHGGECIKVLRDGELLAPQTAERSTYGVVAIWRGCKNQDSAHTNTDLFGRLLAIAEGQNEPESAASSDLAFDTDTTSQKFGQLLGNGKA